MAPGYCPYHDNLIALQSYMFNHVFVLTGCDLLGTEAVSGFPVSSLGQDT